jgi:murein DD-endopeptidase MepM/ murein hydrolase activator NlpD
MRARLPFLIARLRLPVLWVAGALLVAAGFLKVPFLAPAGAGCLVVGMAMYLRLGAVRRERVELGPPVAGRWLAINSPANRVPSHGLHAYGQTYAIDLVHEPADRVRPPFGMAPVFRPPADFPAFGQPVLAPADAIVARVHGRERDHLSRNSWPALLYLVLEGGLRELTGPSRILGNHVVLDLGGGVFALLAHLRKGSIRVRPGQRVVAGQQLAECGNSGNSTEPHLHLQLMDRPGVLFAAGLPFGFAAAGIDGELRNGLPANGRPFVATPPAPGQSSSVTPTATSHSDQAT